MMFSWAYKCCALVNIIIEINDIIMIWSKKVVAEPKQMILNNFCLLRSTVQDKREVPSKKDIEYNAHVYTFLLTIYMNSSLVGLDQ